jgi:2-aminoadipate transaminase
VLAMRPPALDAGVAYVPGPPFHVGDDGRNSMRLSFSHLTESELETAVERLAPVVRGALAEPNAAGGPSQARVPSVRPR